MGKDLYLIDVLPRRMEYPELKRAVREQRVRLRVPSGIGRMNLLHLNVRPDGTCEMLESEAESFLRAE